MHEAPQAPHGKCAHPPDFQASPHSGRLPMANALTLQTFRRVHTPAGFPWQMCSPSRLSDKSTLALRSVFDRLHAFPNKQTSLEVRGQLMCTKLNRRWAWTLICMEWNHTPRSEFTPELQVASECWSLVPYRFSTKRSFDHTYRVGLRAWANFSA